MLARPLYICDHSDRLLCPIPLKIEPYSGCSGKCAYCSRSGLRAADKATSPQANSYRYIEKFFFQDKRCMERSLIDRRCPVQIGANSDPLQPIERGHKVTLRVLRILQDRQYPAIVTTKFPNALTDGEYLRTLEGLPLILQVSISSGDSDLLSRLEPGAPDLSQRLQALEILHEAGVEIMVRLAPYDPLISGDVEHLLGVIRDTGVRKIQLGFLKVFHSGGCGQRIGDALGFDLIEASPYFENCGVFSARSLKEQKAQTERLEGLAADLGMTVITCDDLTRSRDWRCCCGTYDIPGFENVAGWSYFTNGWRITDHTCFETYLRGHDCPWHVEFEQEWDSGKLERAVPELIFNHDDKTYTRRW